MNIKSEYELENTVDALFKIMQDYLEGKYTQPPTKNDNKPNPIPVNMLIPLASKPHYGLKTEIICIAVRLMEQSWYIYENFSVNPSVYEITIEGWLIITQGGFLSKTKKQNQIIKLQLDASQSTIDTNLLITKIQKKQTKIFWVTGFAAVMSGIASIGQLYITVKQQQSSYKASEDIKPTPNYLSPLCQDTTCAKVNTTTIKKILSK